MNTFDVIVTGIVIVCFADMSKAWSHGRYKQQSLKVVWSCESLQSHAGVWIELPVNKTILKLLHIL